MKISIIIVNYNTARLLYECLKSITDNLFLEYEIIVVDNASKDKSISLCAEFWQKSNIKLIQNAENMGFSKANNQGAEIAQGEILHFLNPDTRFEVLMDDNYKQALAQKDYVYINKLLNADGSMENVRKPIPCLRDLFYWNVCRAKSRYWCLGASIIISRENFLKIGGWCEDYFLYAEDTEFFYQLWKNNITIKHLSTVIFHHRGASSSGIWSKYERELVVQKSARIFYKRHFSTFEYIMVKLYFIFFDLLKRPKKTWFNIKTWIASYK